MKFWKEEENKPAFMHARLATAYFSKSFFISSLMLPKERRWATFALYGFCRHADNIIDNPRQRSADEIIRENRALEEEIKIAYRSGESEHPIIRPFIVVAKKYGIPMEYPLELLDGVQMDIQNRSYKTFDDLYLFCYRVAGVVGLMMTHVLGYKDKAAFKYAEKLGVAMQLTNILRDVKEDKDIGRIYIPQDEMKQFGVNKSDILNEQMTENLRKLIKNQVQRAHQYYREAEAGIAMLKTESQFAIYAASRIYRGILYKIEARDYNPFEGRVFITQMKKLGVLLQEILRTKFRILKEHFSLTREKLSYNPKEELY